MPIRSKNFPQDGVSDSGSSGSSPWGRAATTTRLPHTASRRAAVAAAGPPPTTSTSHEGRWDGMEPARYNSRMLRRCALAAGALLAAFHVWLLANQMWTGHLTQPDVLLRWLVAGVLVGALAMLGRRGHAVVFGRRAVAVWLLAALLHGPALANDLDGFATPSLPEASVTLAPSILGSLLGLALVALAAVGAASVAHRSLTSVSTPARGARGRSAASSLGFLPRPPPLR